ncbi:succinate dehydrogenase [Paraburkholderia sp. UCT31]|uniref:succinate dehydrogenase n=1 Tax=Paraburkholderia sp. UCT31 TaxID=2615209 RepID=UPI001655DE14|nr:succinate dehydrogenase [Paraburkholderia sp. UCT31]MBC8739707.1 succinate dehydrogenase [Paraburkholderia sp. UCT31]
MMNGWRLQRLSAMVLTLCVAVHLVIMIIVVHGGLSAANVIARLHGNTAWAVFYSVFVLASSAHVPVGLRRIAEEWLGWRGRSVGVASVIVGIALAIAGLRAVFALVGGPQ